MTEWGAINFLGGEMKLRPIVLTLVLCFIAITIGFAASHDAHLGTWKLNEAKSKFTPGTGKNHTVVYEAAGDNIKIIVDGVNAEGKPSHNEWTGKFDGKDYPVTGDPNTDMRSYILSADGKLALTNKKGGKTTALAIIVISPDGKTRTITVNGTDAQGKKFENLSVYDKQ
jgi:hypothetical protein